MTKTQEQKIRDDERRRIGKMLIAAAKNKGCHPDTAATFRDLGKVLKRPHQELMTEGLMIILDEMIDEAVAAGKGERITIRGKPGYRTFPRSGARA